METKDYVPIIIILVLAVVFALYRDWTETKEDLKRNIEDEKHLKTGGYKWILRDGKYVMQVEYAFWEMDRSWTGVRKFYWKDATPEEIEIVLKEPPYV